MTKLEKKFRLETFDQLLALLDEKHIPLSKDSHATHYYAPMRDSVVTKIVEDDEGIRITQLKDIDGTFEFIKREYVSSHDGAVDWMHSRGFSDLKRVAMHSRIFEYHGGHIELIDINNGSLLSVVLYFEPNKHERMTKEFGLENAELIEVPYSQLV